MPCAHVLRQVHAAAGGDEGRAGLRREQEEEQHNSHLVAELVIDGPCQLVLARKSGKRLHTPACLAPSQLELLHEW